MLVELSIPHAFLNLHFLIEDGTITDIEKCQEDLKMNEKLAQLNKVTSISKIHENGTDFVDMHDLHACNLELLKELD